jgi:hypothetical protein
MRRTRWVHAARRGAMVTVFLWAAGGAPPGGAFAQEIPGAPPSSGTLPVSEWTEAEVYGSAGPWRDGLAMASGAYQPPPAPPARRPILRRQRPNTISLGVQGSYGAVRGNSRIADGFTDGPGYAFRFRYMLHPSFALGFSFENHHYYDRGGAESNELGAGDSSVTLTTVSVEGVYYLNRASEVNPYFVGGFGHAAPDIVDELRGSTRVNEGIFLMLGIGLERFIRSRFSLDFSLRGNALVSNSELTTFASLSGGIHLYPGD